MPIDATTCARLIADIYDVALEGRRLDRVLGAFARLAGVGRAAIISTDPRGRKAITAASGLEASAIDSYNREYHLLDTIVPARRSGPTVFIPGTTAAETVYPGYERSDLFNGWARPNGAHQIAFTTVGDPGATRSSLLFVSPPEDRGFGARDQLDLLRLAMPHFLRMFQLADRLGPVEAQDASLLAVIERWPMGVVMLDAKGRVAHVTRRARALLDEGDGLDLTMRGATARQPAAQRRIEAMIAGALRLRGGAPEGPPLPVLVPRPSCRPPYVLQAMALPPRRRDGFGPATGMEACAVLVTLVDPSRAPRPALDVVRSVFGLTQAEATVALRIFEGGGPRRAAEETGIALSTVRTHLLRIFEKTSVHRQADLVRLLASLAPGPGD